MSGCSKSNPGRIDTAESIAEVCPDSARQLLSHVDYFYLDNEYKAKYALAKAIAHAAEGKSLVTDTLLPVAIDYYKSTGDTVRWLKSNILYVTHLQHGNQADEAKDVIDGAIAAIPADSIDLQYQLRWMRVKMLMRSGDYDKAVNETDWLIYHTHFDRVKFKNACMKMGLLFFGGKNDRAIAWGDSIMGAAYAPTKEDPEWADFMGDYAEILDESGHSERAIGIVEEILRSNPGFSADDKVGYIVSLAKYNANIGNLAKAKSYLATVDTLGFNPANIDNDYKNYLNLLKSAIEFKTTGHLSGTPDKQLVNERRLQHRVNADAVAEMNQLSAWKMQLTLEKQNVAIVLLSVCLVLVIVASVLWWLLRRRQRRLLEAEERIDTLNEMLRQVKKSENSDDKNTMLKRMVLQQMGILKTFAASPTSQNQEALRKISSIGAQPDSQGDLVDWDNLYAMVDELYEGFHDKLGKHYQGLFTDKETQIICLLKADFSTKEIGVLTQQSSATIYVRKSAIRKKLNTPEGGDFIAQIDDKIQAS